MLILAVGFKSVVVVGLGQGNLVGRAKDDLGFVTVEFDASAGGDLVSAPDGLISWFAAEYLLCILAAAEEVDFVVVETNDDMAEPFHDEHRADCAGDFSMATNFGDLSCSLWGGVICLFIGRQGGAHGNQTDCNPQGQLSEGHDRMWGEGSLVEDKHGPGAWQSFLSLGRSGLGLVWGRGFRFRAGLQNQGSCVPSRCSFRWLFRWAVVRSLIFQVHRNSSGDNCRSPLYF